MLNKIIGLPNQIFKNKSLKTRITAALLMLVVTQGVIMIGMITFSGAIRRNAIIAYNNLASQSYNRKIEIQDAFAAKRKNLTNAAIALNESIFRILEEYQTGIESVNTDAQVMNAVLDESMDQLIDFTRYNTVTGVFVVFDATPDVSDIYKPYRTCLHIRDSSPGIVTAGNNNLMLEYGRVDIARSRGIAVDYLWTRDLQFSGDYSRDFYFKPITAAHAVTDPDKPQQAGYWSQALITRADDIQVMIYSLPLLTEDGQPYGVMGFELDINSLRALLPSSEIPYDRGFYLMGVNGGDGLYNDQMIASAAHANRFLSGASAKLTLKNLYEDGQGTVYRITNPNFSQEHMLGAYSPLELYDRSSPFYAEEWVLLCCAPQSNVLAGANDVRRAVGISLSATILLAVLLALIVVNIIFDPIKWLQDKVRGIDPEQPVRFEKLNVREIDELSGAFEVLSDRVSEAAARLFKIIELVELPLGSFEINRADGKLRLNNYLLQLLDQVLPVVNPSALTMSDWQRFMDTLVITREVLDGEGEIVYVTGARWNTKRWFRIRSLSERDRDIGVVLDVSDDILQKQRLEFERNYDPLTKLYNRRMFYIKAYELIHAKADTIGIMMFADIDDLKFVNDQYGHETGDDYIRSFANFLQQFAKMGAVVSRVSGDEFVMFMTGFPSKEAAKQTFFQIFNNIRDLAITTPQGNLHKIRVSAGLAFYPEDATDIKELSKYADYAMYEAKHTAKGEVRTFNMESYNKNYFVINMKNVLDLFIEEERIRFMFQPIVDVRTGEVYAYEALMRPMVPEFKSPSDVLKVARSQSKMYQVEKLTLTVAFKWLAENKLKMGRRKLFINSIPGVILHDLPSILLQYKSLSDMLVFEITENEFSDKADTQRKVAMFRSYGALLAIDDYGSGYSNEMGLLIIAPDFLKIDMGFIRSIDKDNDKQQLVANIVAFATKKRIRTIAEGVETREEMETVVRLGVNYIQGYYLARPAFEMADIEQNAKNMVKNYYLYCLSKRKY